MATATASLQEQEGPEPAENCSVPSVSAPPLSTASAIWSVITTPYSDVDGLDYQILLEADFLVNLF